MTTDPTAPTSAPREVPATSGRLAVAGRWLSLGAGTAGSTLLATIYPALLALVVVVAVALAVTVVVAVFLIVVVGTDDVVDRMHRVFRQLFNRPEPRRPPGRALRRPAKPACTRRPRRPR